MTEPYEITAWDQNTNADPKINLHFILPFLEVQLFKFYFVGLLETSYAENGVIRLLDLP